MKNKKILVIEDEEAVRENLVDLLFASDFDAFPAINGLDGLSKMQTIKPDLIICDINMPEMDGFELLDIMRRNPDTYSIPFLFLTALTDNKIQRKGMTLGADDYITKPYDSMDLINAIKNKLEKFDSLRKTFSKSSEVTDKNDNGIIPFEILTPLNNIRGFTQVLINSCDELDSDERKSILNIISHSSDRLIKLIENYTMLLKLEDSKSYELMPNPEPNNIKKLITNKQLYLQEYYEDKEISPVVNVDDCYFYFDFNHLNKIVSEVIENAYRYSIDNKHVYIEGKKTEVSYLLKVEHYSKGMSANFIDNITNFSFANTPEFEQQSYGLGLALVKKLVELHNGNFEFSSIPYETTTVKIMLPIIV